MAHLPRISQKHSTFCRRKILPPGKVKSLLAKHGKIYQVFHRQGVPLPSFKKHHISPHAPLGTVTSTSPMAVLKAIDFLKLDRAAGEYEYILVNIDQLTRYAQTYATPNKSSKTTAEKIFVDFVLKFGMPHRILHDQGEENENKLFDETEKYFGIKRCRTTPHHTLGNGIVECLNSAVIQMLRTLSE